MVLVCGQSEVAYWTMSSRRRQDVAARAVEALTRWAFDEVGFHSVSNPSSCLAAVKTGFDFEGIKRGAGLHVDGWHDMHLHARINGD
jgi:RimJ/RimL family protein N-acetyltransferase